MTKPIPGRPNTKEIPDDQPDGSSERPCEISYFDGKKRWRVQVGEREVVIGTAPDADIFVDDDTISSHHFAIRRDGIAYLVRDLGSTNGTFVSNVRINEAYITPGTTVRAGNSRFRFAYNDAPDRMTPEPSTSG